MEALGIKDINVKSIGSSNPGNMVHAAIKGLNAMQSFETVAQLSNSPGAKKTRRRIGRGSGSGMGKTATKGHKGQKARSGAAARNRVGFEGGQMPLYRRSPKVGFRSYAKRTSDLLSISLETLAGMKGLSALSAVNMETLKELGLLRQGYNRVKVIGNSLLSKKLTFEVHLISKGAKEAIEKSGGTVKIIEAA
ncbi:hypothetical protein CHS0354_027353 [Potamilus streckersoni]|uniref:Large ribosomal subunit protein uL15m n=1 Tax=Potamilus streckersoni TaxID=2493646 RepID=A0AAE0VZ60_9BIVA|nr:hypothetical protein CHS0354_027353 [Potamilus streckersoni]